MVSFYQWITGIVKLLRLRCASIFTMSVLSLGFVTILITNLDLTTLESHITNTTDIQSAKRVLQVQRHLQNADIEYLARSPTSTRRPKPLSGISSPKMAVNSFSAALNESSVLRANQERALDGSTNHSNLTGQIFPRLVDSRANKHPNWRDYSNIQIKKIVPADLMKEGPFKFLPNYRNPCWSSQKLDNVTMDTGIKCLPYFYLVGAPKSGTTDLFRRLVKHPEITDQVAKEPHWMPRGRFSLDANIQQGRMYFDSYSVAKYDLYLKQFTTPINEYPDHIYEDRPSRNRQGAVANEFLGLDCKRLTAFPIESAVEDTYRTSLDHYLQYFNNAAKVIHDSSNEAGFHPVIVGDCSASTLWDNMYWSLLPEYRNLTEPPVTNADYIHHLNPKTKILVILRNPIDRLYSDYLFFHYGERGPEIFHEGVLKAIQEMNDCLHTYSLRVCVHKPMSSLVAHDIRIRIGIYHEHLKEYYRVFPTDQILVIKLEDFSKQTDAYMAKIYDFLGVRALTDDELAVIGDAEKHANSRRAKDKAMGDMLAETRQLLQDFYRYHNEELTKLLGEQFNFNMDEETRYLISIDKTQGTIL